ncbi:MAG: phosphate acyltransferase PlsX [Syntrophomonadales bacterium]
MRIAVDAMGGDHAPHEIVKGSVKAVETLKDTELILVGDQEVLKEELKRCNWSGEGISIHHASQVIAMNEHPAMALRKKKDSSIMVSTMLVKMGQADAVVSCGNTGAQMAAAIFGWGRFDGIDRPAIGSLIPRYDGFNVLLDIGANVDVKAEQLVQFALMGRAYAEIALGIENPRIGLLSNGEEETKGNQVTLAAHAMLKDLEGLNFVGNVEGRDLFNTRADVVVCDGFFGNTIIKVMEGLMSVIMKRLLDAGVDPRSLLQDFDYTQIGGAPLLGVKGISVVCHGSSKADAVYNGILQAQNCVSNDMLANLNRSLAVIETQT